ncbi:MAG: hypothetical protein P8020_06560 [Acidobacteriota bacterium]
MEFAALTWLNAALLFVILARGWMENLWDNFKAFYFYVGFSAVHALGSGAILASLGIGSSFYRVWYHASHTLMIFIGAWFFFDVLRCLAPSSAAGIKLARSFLLAAFALVVPVLWTVARLDANPFDRLQAVSLVYKMAVCVLAFCYVAEHREIELGSNLGGILTSMGLLTGCQSLNFISYFSGEIQPRLFQILVPTLYAGALIVLVFSLWERDPVRFDPSRRELNVKTQQGFRVLLRSLLPR